MKVTVQEFRHYTLKANKTRGLAYLTGAKPGAGHVAEAQADGLENVLEALKQKLRGIEAARVHDEIYDFDVPTAHEFECALSGTDFSAPVGAMLDALVSAGSSGMTAGALANVAGYADYSATNLHLGRAAAALGGLVGVRPPNDPNEAGKTVATAIIATESSETDSSENWIWVVRPEFAAARTLKNKGATHG